MISKLRVTFALVLTIIIMSTLVVFISKDIKQYKYTIDISNRVNEYTNHYTTNGSCIKFKNSNGDTVTLCGNYSIIERK